MADLRYKKKALWKVSITPEERAEIEQLDTRIAVLSEERKELTRARYAITNRCTVRTLAWKEKENVG